MLSFKKIIIIKNEGHDTSVILFVGGDILVIWRGKISISDKWVVLFFEMQVVTIADCVPTAGPALFEP
jgi:hypothetical protein